MSIRLSGYEEDNIWNDDTGSVALDFLPAAGLHPASSVCRADGVKYNCCEYSLAFEVEGGDPIPAPALSPAAKALYDSYLLP